MIIDALVRYIVMQIYKKIYCRTFSKSSLLHSSPCNLVIYFVHLQSDFQFPKTPSLCVKNSTVSSLLELP